VQGPPVERQGLVARLSPLARARVKAVGGAGKASGMAVVEEGDTYGAFMEQGVGLEGVGLAGGVTAAMERRRWELAPVPGEPFAVH
jgi:hypothetical protein